jgi:hypothetical protein
MWVHDIDIIYEEHAVEGFDEKHDLFRHEYLSPTFSFEDPYQYVCGEEDGKAQIVWGICFL